MKKIWIFLLVCLVAACATEETPQTLTANVVVSQRASLNTVWYSALVVSGEDINQAFANRLRYSDYHAAFEKPIQANQPFAFIFDVEEFTDQVNVILSVSQHDQRLVEVFSKPDLPEVYIYPNGNREAAQEMADEIDFEANVFILD